MKTALITGSSRGIGAATALAAAGAGYSVCVNYLERADCAEKVCEAVRRLGVSAIACQADVADAAAVKAMVRRCEAELGRVSLLVNNAGIAQQELFQDTTREKWDRIFAVNVGGCYNTIQAVLPGMLHEHNGSIVNISSIWGVRGGACEAAYSASKHAVVGLTRALAAELAPSGIRVNSVAPGCIATDMVKALGEDTVKMLEDEIPMGRLGRPEEIGDMVIKLAETAYATGQVLTVDGGFLL